jgi:ubiquitin-conjugating enzyme E2 variant
MDVTAHPFAGTFVVALLLVVIMTNQIHKWAHLAHVGRPVPSIVRALQRSRVILSPEHHQIHHTPPYDTHYCITSGITNAPLARIGFWPVMMRACRFVGRIAPGSPAVTGDTGPMPEPMSEQTDRPREAA